MTMAVPRDTAEPPILVHEVRRAIVYLKNKRILIVFG